MFVRVSDFASEWKNESAATQKVMDALTDASLSQEVAPGYRALGQLAWHVVTSQFEMMERTGLQLIPPPGEFEELAPTSANAIAEAYRHTSQAILEAVESGWTDESLLESVDMYGESWSNGLTLSVLIKHEIHHRGQLMVLLRQAGVQVPDIYGPTKEDWAKFNMQPHL